MRVRRKRVYRKERKGKETLLQRWFGETRNLAILSGAILVVLLIFSGGYMANSYLKRGIQTRFNQALDLYSRGEYGEAMEGFREVASSFAGGRLGPLSLLYMGNIYYREGNYREAIETYKGITSSDEIGLLALYSMAKAYEAMGEFGEAKEVLNLAMERAGEGKLKDLIAFELASLYGRTGERDRAIGLYRSLKEEGPDALIRDFVTEAMAGLR